MRPLTMIAAIAGAMLILAASAHAQSPEPADAAPQGELVLGTKDAPPFAMKAADGTW
jgi:polar amino acid transport system substrate-binding protein